uniref:Ig-like domain-containing protein n=1 Tax=Colobus angolensis palliatus TaxID=336983 RepID=A0A2K5KC68_COLAP
MLLLLLLLPLLWGRERVEGEGQRGDGYTPQVQREVTAQEGLCVDVPCSFSHPKTDSPEVHGYWFQQGANTAQDAPAATNNLKRQVKKEIQGRFHIRDARRKDQRLFFFRLERGHVKWNYMSNQLHVLVAVVTHRPSISTLGTMESGCPGNLACSVPWACLTTTRSSVLTLIPKPQDHGTNLTCQVTLPGMGVTMTRTIQLNVSCECQDNLTVTVFRANGTAPTALGNSSSHSVLEGQSLRLVCAVDSNPPARLSWTRGSLTLSPSQSSNPGLLELPQVHVKDEGELTCRAQNPRGSQHIPLSLSLQNEGTGTTWPVSGVMLWAVGGAGATALAFLSFCVIFMVVRSCRKKSARPAVGIGDTGMEDANAIRGSACQ